MKNSKQNRKKDTIKSFGTGRIFAQVPTLPDVKFQQSFTLSQKLLTFSLTYR